MQRQRVSLWIVVVLAVAQLMASPPTENPLFAQELLWAKRAGGSGGVGIEQGNSIALDSAGNSYVTGRFASGAIFGPGEANETILNPVGNGDIFLAKYHPDGNLAWVKRAGGGGSDQGTAVALDSLGNIYVTGFFSNSATFGPGELNQTVLTGPTASPEIFVAKYDSTGNLIWANRAGGSNNDQPTAIAVDGLGNSYVTGFFQLTATFGPGESNQTTLTSAGNNDIFIAKYNNDGTLAWVKRLGGTQPDQGVGIAADVAGSVYVTGVINSAVIFGLGEPNQTTLSSGPGTNAFLAKYDTDGSLAWAKAPFNLNNAAGLGVALDNSGSIYATGWFAGTITLGPGEPAATVFTASGTNAIFVAKYNNNGSLVWAKMADAAAPTINQQISRVAVDGTGRSYLTGYFNGTAVFGGGEANQTSLVASATGLHDIFVARYNPDGRLAWAKKAGGGALDQSYGIAADSVGSSYVTGFFTGTATFGENANAVIFPLAATNQDIFVAKFSAKLSQTIAFGALVGKTYGDAAFSVGATASSGLSVTFSAFGSCNIAGTLVALTGAGSCTITASQAGDDNHYAAPDIQQTFSIAKATPVIAWNNPADITQGTALSGAQLNAIVTFNNNNLAGTFLYSPALGTVLPLGGNQQLTLNFAPFDSANFNTPSPKTVLINVVDGIPPAVLSIVAANANPSNAANVSWTVTFSENVNGVDAADFALSASGVAGAMIGSVTPVSGTVFTVTANTGSGSGTLGLNLVDNDSINDGTNVLGGAGAGNGNVIGQVYDIDRTPPDTTITSGPTGTITVNMATFQFASNEANSTFECRLDSAAFTSCTSGISYNNLTNASHTFQVRTIDSAGNVDPTPASQSFVVNHSSSVPGVTVRATKRWAREGRDKKGRFEISRKGGTSGALTVRYAISGSAMNGTDYRALSGVVVIPTGKSKTRIDVIPLNDNSVEGNEHVILSLLPNPAYAIGMANNATVIIKDRKPDNHWDDEEDDDEDDEDDERDNDHDKD